MLDRKTKTLYKNLGSTIKAERLNRGISMKKLAIKVKLTDASICKIERGESGVLFHNVLKVFNAMGINDTLNSIISKQ